jgi:hypothetical protein
LAVVFSVGIFAAGTSVAADAPLASDNDNPAAPNNGTAHARCFRFEACFARDMVGSSHTFGQMFPLAGKTLAGFGQFPQRCPDALCGSDQSELARNSRRFNITTILRPEAFDSSVGEGMSANDPKRTS